MWQQLHWGIPGTHRSAFVSTADLLPQYRRQANGNNNTYSSVSFWQLYNGMLHQVTLAGATITNVILNSSHGCVKCMSYSQNHILPRALVFGSIACRFKIAATPPRKFRIHSPNPNGGGVEVWEWISNFPGPDDLIWIIWQIVTC